MVARALAQSKEPLPVLFNIEKVAEGIYAGLPGYRQIAPSAEIIASAKTRSLMVEVGPARLKSAIDSIPRSIENFSWRLAESKTGVEKAYYTRISSSSSRPRYSRAA